MIAFDAKLTRTIRTVHTHGITYQFHQTGGFLTTYKSIFQTNHVSYTNHCVLVLINQFFVTRCIDWFYFPKTTESVATAYWHRL